MKQYELNFQGRRPQMSLTSGYIKAKPNYNDRVAANSHNTFPLD